MSDGEADTIRLYEPDDREGFLSLYETVFGDDRDDEWFEWRFLDAPYLDHVPMFVATVDGEVVGTRPFLPFRLRVGEETCVGIQTCDTMVHPDHRRQGLFARMTERAFEYYESLDEPSVSFNVPNAISRPGYLDLGCRVVGQVTTHYRVQNPGSLVGDGRLSAVEPLATPLARGYYGLVDRLADVPGGVQVTHHDHPPADLLGSLYESAVPARIHAVRDDAFYDWRYDNPTWTYEAYTASVDGEAVAGVVVGTQERGETTAVRVTDVVPLIGGQDRERGLTAILDRIVRDNAGADLIAIAGDAFPADVLDAYGFHADDERPLSTVTTPTILISRPLDGGDGWIRGGHDLADPDSWLLAYSDQNTA